MPTGTLKEKIRILFAEDILMHHRMSVEILIKEKIQFEPFLVDSKEAFIAALNDFSPDLVITDYQMPEFTGMEAMLLTLEHDPTIPVIILTGSISEEVAVECMRMGATNYVLKENLIRLPFAVKEAIRKKLALVENAKALQELTESQAKLQAITTSAGDAIIMMDHHGLISFWNPAAMKLFGFTEEEAIGKELHHLIAPPEFHQVFSENFSKFLETGEGSTVGKRLELEAQHKEGNRFYISLNLSSVKLKEHWHAIGLISDITIRKKAEQELISAKQKAESGDRLKSVFINNISHEVRTPLNGILGFASLLTKTDITEEEKENYMYMIKASSKRLLDTITSYMDISMIVTGNLQLQIKPFDLNQLLRSYLDRYELTCTLKNIQLDLQIPEQPRSLTIKSDSTVFSKILTHLLDNAVKFTRQGSITFGYSTEGSFLNFFIRDTGIGIIREMQSLIFERFIQEENSNTREFDGSGLGLSIVQGLVKLLGGEITLESVKGKGTTILFRVPYQDSTGSESPEGEMPGSARLVNKPVILVAEDDEANYLFLKTLLKRLNYQVVWAVNGKEAVDLCRSHNDITLALIDIKMPEMDGLTATRLIKSKRPDLVIIAVTAFAMSGDEQKAREAGCDDYIAKPITEEELTSKLSAFIQTEPL